jgi:glycosyltransferase involved in cell wall biosynthesis
MGKRILFLSHRFAPDIGGLSASATRLATHLGALGHQVHVVAWTRALPAQKRVSGPYAPGVTLHRLGPFAHEDLTLQHTMSVLEWLHGEVKFDLVWGHYLFPTGFLAVLFGAQVGVASTVSARGNDVDALAFPPGDFARLTWTLERATHVTAVTEDMARKIRALAGARMGGRLSVLHNVVDPALFSPGPANEALAATWGILPGETVLGFSGELRHKKGLPYVLEALTRVRQQRPACLLVIGEVRPRDQAALAQFAAEHPEDFARLRVTGHLDLPAQVAEALRLCDVVLQPSLWDGMPNALLEAMACGRLCVGSDAGGIPEVLRHGVDGVVLPRHRLHLLGDAVLELLDLPAPERAAMAVAARERAATAFHPDRESELLEQLMKRI